MQDRPGGSVSFGYSQDSANKEHCAFLIYSQIEYELHLMIKKTNIAFGFDFGFHFWPVVVPVRYMTVLMDECACLVFFVYAFVATSSVSAISW